MSIWTARSSEYSKNPLFRSGPLDAIVSAMKDQRPIGLDDEQLELLRRFYQEVDQRARTLAEANEAILQCRRGCADCCVDDLTVFQVEADHIRHFHGDLLTGGRANGAGGCAFLDGQGACRIYEHRPYVCRTQGLPLRWLDETPDGRIMEMRDICPLNDRDQGLEDLPDERCWHIGPFEEVLANIQAYAHGGELARVPLRDLFRSQP